MSEEISFRDELLAILGREKMHAFLVAYGGRDYRFPLTSRGRGYKELVALVGEKQAADLIEAFAAERFYVPMPSFAGDAEARYLLLVERGMNNRSIAAHLGVSERHVRRVLAGCGVVNPNNDYSSSMRPRRALNKRPADAPSRPVSIPHTRKPEMAG